MSSFQRDIFAYNLAKVTLYNANSQLYFDILLYIDPLVFNEIYQFFLSKKVKKKNCK